MRPLFNLESPERTSKIGRPGLIELLTGVGENEIRNQVRILHAKKHPATKVILGGRKRHWLCNVELTTAMCL